MSAISDQGDLAALERGVLTLYVSTGDDFRDEVQDRESSEGQEDCARLVVEAIHPQDHDKVDGEVGDGESACRG